MSDFERELANLINKCSVENLSDTADWILARYLMECLVAFRNATGARDESKIEPFPEVTMEVDASDVVGISQGVNDTNKEEEKNS